MNEKTLLLDVVSVLNQEGDYVACVRNERPRFTSCATGKRRGDAIAAVLKKLSKLVEQIPGQFGAAPRGRRKRRQ